MTTPFEVPFPSAGGYPVWEVIDGNLNIVDPTGTGKYGILTAGQVNAPVLSGLAPSGDQTGSTDQANIQGLLNLSGICQLGIGTFYYNQQLTLPSQAALLGQNMSYGIPIANYGAGGLPLQGTILKATATFANPNSGTGTVLLNNASGQGGGQRIYNLSFDWSGLPNGNNLHGIFIENNTACVILGYVNGYGGTRQLGGDALHCVASGGSPPDLLVMSFCHWAGATGYGVTLSGVADSHIYATECTANGSGGWNIINCNNTRMVGVKGETSTAGPGYLVTFQTGFTGIVHAIGATSQSNVADGWKITGAGTGTLQLIGCSDDGSGINAGSGGGGYSGLNVTSFSGTVLATGWNTRVNSSTTSPQYGVSMTNSNVVTLQGGGNVAGATASYNNGGGNTSFIGTVAPGGYLCTPTQYAPGSLQTFSTTSATYAAVSSANINTGSFTAPPSGSVMVTASFVCNQATGNSIIGFNLAAHGTITPMVANAWQPTLANTAVNGITVAKFLVTGLTPGTTYNFDLMFASATAGDSLSVTAQANTATTLGTNKGGPVLMEVQAV